MKGQFILKATKKTNMIRKFTKKERDRAFSREAHSQWNEYQILFLHFKQF